MNRGRKLKQLRKMINKYGTIVQEYKRPPDPYYRPYRKGSYYVQYWSEELGLSLSGGHVDRYRMYQSVVECIRDCLRNPISR